MQGGKNTYANVFDETNSADEILGPFFNSSDLFQLQMYATEICLIGSPPAGVGTRINLHAKWVCLNPKVARLVESKRMFGDESAAQTARSEESKTMLPAVWMIITVTKKQLTWAN